MSNTFLTVAYVLLFAMWAISSFVLIPVPVNLIVTSTLIVYIGSHKSLRLLVSESEGGAAQADKEVLSAQDAYRFPIVGSVALGSLYLAFKYYKDIANVLLSCYFSLVGVYTLTSTLSPVMAKVVTGTKKFGFKRTFPLVGEVDMLFTFAEIICLCLSCVFSAYYFQTKHFLMNNVLGISFCIQSIERISIGSYKIGCILLVGLFFYDIFWVFGTDVMVTVAKSLDGPIKLLFPRALATATTKAEFSLLGLGDIVIPGLFVALLLRLDAVKSGIMKVKGAAKRIEYESFPKPFFTVNVISYALGLVTTVGVMYFFNAAQPALLYLVPACIGGSLAVGAARSELSELFAYDEEEKENEKKPKAA